MAHCEINLFACLAKIGGLFGIKENRLSAASTLPIKKVNLVKIRPDLVEKIALVCKKSLILITGDALSTVDPSAVLGCNTAIELAVPVLQAYKALGQGMDRNQIAAGYAEISKKLIERNHSVARAVRKKFDPANSKPLIRSKL